MSSVLQPLRRIAWWPAFLAVGLYVILSAAAIAGAHAIDLEHGAVAAGPPAQALMWPGVWARWDSGYYLEIVRNGYAPGSATPMFYPLYPSLIWLTSAISGWNPMAVGTVLSVVFVAAAWIVLDKIVALDYGADTARLTVLLLALFPTAFFFYSVYTEALFLLLSVAAYSLARTRHWAWAVAVSILAGFSRYNGFLISVLVAAEYLAQHGFGRRYWVKGLLFLVPGFAGFVLYQVYQLVRFGDLFYSFQLQRNLQQRYVTWPWNSIWDTVVVAVLGRGVEGNWFWRLVGWQELFFTILFIVLCVLSWKLLRPSLAAYLSLSVLMFVSSHGPDAMGLLSMPRYLLVLFPGYIVMALLLRSRTWRWIVLAGFSLLLLGYALWFGSGRWVA